MHHQTSEYGGLKFQSRELFFANDTQMALARGSLG
jgi:hypothetical protein